MEIRELTVANIDDIKAVILETFSKEPWNDDWSDGQQFHLYILD